VPRARLPLLVLLAVAGALAASPAYAADAADAPADDLAAPAVVALAATPGSVDVSTEPAAIVVTARLTDASGVATASLTFGDAAPVALQLLAGDDRDGIWSSAATVPAYAPHGTLAARVQVQDLAGNAATSAVDTVQVLDAVPAAPANVAVDGGTVTWQAPAPNGGSDVTGYTVTAAPVDGGTATTSDEPATARGATLALAGGTRYVVGVAARNAAGTGAPTSVDVAGTPVVTTPGAPLDAAATPDDRGLHVTWQAPAADGGSAVTGYDVTAGGATTRTGAEERSAALTGLANGTPYDVTVTAVNAVGAGLPATAQATPRTVPAAPAIGTASGGDGSATVRWSAPASDGGDAVEAYVVTAHPSGKVYVLPPTSRGTAVAGLANGVATTFTVTARNAAGTGPSSRASNAVTPRLIGKLVVVALPRGTAAYGTASVVKAALRTAGGVGLPNYPVDLVAQVKPSTGWRRVAAGRTDASGNVTLRANLPATATLRLHHAPDSVAAGDAGVRTVGVTTRLSTTPAATRIRVGGTVSAGGGIAPAHPTGSPVRLQRYTSKGWVTIASGRMTSTTAFRVSWKPAGAGAWYLRVVKPADADHITGFGPTWRQQVDGEQTVDVARQIRGNARIELDTVHSSGVVDGATAERNVVDLSNGLLARRSAYENAPGGSTRVDIRVLEALRGMGMRGSVTVSEIAGGSHAVGSAHYSGEALDIRFVNGVHVAPGAAYGMAVDTCRAYGARHVYYPAYDPYGGHQNHVHCDWA
jgi:hypothetical protein